MSTMGKCCCCACVTPLVLPDVAINNMTGGAWSGIECCFTKTFTFINPPADSTLQSTVWTSEFTRNRTEEVNTVTLPFPRLYNQPAPDFCEEAYEECCPPNDAIIGTINEILNETRTMKFEVAYRMDYITLEYSRQKVDCGEEEPCKYVVKLSFFYSYEYSYELEIVSSREVTSTPGVSCFECYGPDNNGLDCSFQQTATSGGVAPSGGSGTFRVDRIKYFDTPPIGNVNFTPSDIDTCDRSDLTKPNCETSGNYVSLTCITPTGTTPPCWCGGITTAATSTSYTYESCSPSAMTYNCDVPPEQPLCTAMGIQCPPIEIDCTYSASCSALVLPENCNSAPFLGTGLSPGWFYGDQFIPFIVGCCISAFNTLCTGYPFNSKSVCLDTGFAGPHPDAVCDPDCCYSLEAFEANCLPCSDIIQNCYPKYGPPFRTINSDVVTTNCQTNPSSAVCISSPSSIQVTFS